MDTCFPTYAGRENDGTGLYFYRARYYNPAIGRFISEDPLEFAGGINEYVYVDDSPTNYLDPNGLDKKAPNNDPCFNKALAAVGVGPAQLRQRIQTANTHSLLGALMGSLIGNPVLGALAAYGQLVHPGGPQDDQHLPENRSVMNDSDHPYLTAVAAGNVSYGVTCPFGAAACVQAAGIAQTLGGNPDLSGGTLATGYDTAQDTAQILEGQAMRAAGCHQ